MIRRSPTASIGRTLAGAALALLLLGGLAPGGVAPAVAADPTLGDLPVQHEGRIKPVDKFARVHLLAMYGKQKVRSLDLTATDWLAELLSDPAAAATRPVFAVRNPAVVDALALPERDKREYTHDEVIEKLIAQVDQIQDMHRRAPEDRTLVESQLVEIYMSAIRYREISRSLTCLVPQFSIDDPQLARELGLEPGRKVSYFHFILNRDGFRSVLERLESKSPDEWGAGEREVTELAASLSHLRHDEVAAALRLVPPPTGSEQELWAAPWELMDGRELGPRQVQTLLGWEAILAARMAGDPAAEAAEVEKLLAVVATGENQLPQASRLTLETWKDRTDLFTKSLSLYILAFLLLAFSWMGKGRLLRRLAVGALGIGVVLHLGGLGLRMVIMGRPPVSTLYESVVFVGVIAALTGLIVELVRKDGMGLFVGSVIGAVLHFIGFGYAADGDTMGMLVAVLNSNFWLATHVVTITIGYGCSIVAGLAGHVYLFWRIYKPRDGRRLSEMNRNMVGLTLVALFFTLFGTILGGIWADQSWGRFWGWDPKENGALLIVMWQLLLLHGKISDQFKPLGFAAGLVLNNVMVALAWFGVNLLNVGLHSYGFTDNIANNLALFCGFEVLYVAVLYPLARMRTPPNQPEQPEQPSPA